MIKSRPPFHAVNSPWSYPLDTIVFLLPAPDTRPFFSLPRLILRSYLHTVALTPSVACLSFLKKFCSISIQGHTDQVTRLSFSTVYRQAEAFSQATSFSFPHIIRSSSLTSRMAYLCSASTLGLHDPLMACWHLSVKIHFFHCHDITSTVWVLFNVPCHTL